MLLDEHQSKKLFEEAGMIVPQGILITPANLETVRPEFSLPWFLKAQVPTGGRGKSGGILRIETPGDLVPLGRTLFDLVIKGSKVTLLRLECATEMMREFYCSFSVSRGLGSLAFTVGREGGMDIEDLGQDNLLVQEIPMGRGLMEFHLRAAFFHLGVDKIYWSTFRECVKKLYAAVRHFGLLLAEINPLVLTEEGAWIALDGKIEIDDNYLLQHTDLERFYTPEHASREENIAREAGLSFHSLAGRIGLMVNGAGLAMATMDLLNHSDLPAANFMDLGGAADYDRMRTAMTLLFEDQDVTAVLINIFGGVLSCEKVALALREVLEGKAPAKPLVVRLSGNQAELGRQILSDVGSDKLIIVTDMGEAIARLKELDGQESGGAARACSGQCRVDFVPTPFPAEFGFEKDMPLLVQGITGKTAQLHTRLMRAYGTNIVAGVTPFKGGQEVEGVPVYNSVREAVSRHDVAASIVFVPAAFAPEAIVEAAREGIKWIVCITDGLTQQDMLWVREQLCLSDSRLIGPNCPGLIAPGRTKIGIMPDHAFVPGPVAIVSRSGTLTYETAARLTKAGIGQSLCVGIGGDPFIGTSFIDVFTLLAEDDNTRAVVVLGEIGGSAEEELAHWVRETGFAKPVVGFIAGQTAPPGKRLGHAGAILESGRGVQDKLDTMRAAGFSLCDDLGGLPLLVAEALGVANK